MACTFRSYWSSIWHHLLCTDNGHKIRSHTAASYYDHYDYRASYDYDGACYDDHYDYRASYDYDGACYYDFDYYDDDYYYYDYNGASYDDFDYYDDDSSWAGAG